APAAKRTPAARPIAACGLAIKGGWAWANAQQHLSDVVPDYLHRSPEERDERNRSWGMSPSLSISPPAAGTGHGFREKSEPRPFPWKFGQNRPNPLASRGRFGYKNRRWPGAARPGLMR